MAARKLTLSNTSARSTGPRVFGYCRVSAEMRREAGLSIDEQRVKIEARCRENGWTLERVYVHAGVSGSAPLGRHPEGARLLAALRPGDTVVAARMDRCFRSAFDLRRSRRSEAARSPLAPRPQRLQRQWHFRAYRDRARHRRAVRAEPRQRADQGCQMQPARRCGKCAPTAPR